MPRVKKIVLKEEYEKNLREWYADLGAEYGSERPEGDGRYLWDMIESDWVNWSKAPSQADMDKLEQEKADAERERRERIRKDGIRRRSRKSRGAVLDEADKFRETEVAGPLSEYYWGIVQEDLQGRVGEDKLEDLYSSLSNASRKLQKEYETAKRLKMLVGKLKNNILSEHRDGDFDVMYEDDNLRVDLKPVLVEIFGKSGALGLLDDGVISEDNNSPV